MLNVALKLAAVPALMLAAMPAHAMDRLSSVGLTLQTAENPFLSNDLGQSAWYEPRSRLVMVDTRDLPDAPGSDRGPPLLPTATIMPEPMSWAMMIAGLTAIGWSLRSLHRRGGHIVSFV